jgi:hypothetical protein
MLALGAALVLELGFPLNLGLGFSRDRPHPVLVDPLVEARNRSCPTCNLKLHSVPVSLICQCCRAQYYKQARCSGLTAGALDVWKKSNCWECTLVVDVLSAEQEKCSERYRAQRWR